MEQKQSLYSHRDSNIVRTWVLLSAFLIVVIGIGWVFSQVYGDPGILYIAVIFSTVMSVTSYWFSDKIVLSMTHAREVNVKTAPELYRIVENLSITAGLPMPKVYIVDDPSPNAFATGRNPEHGVVAATTGLLGMLDRSELEGVIAHELSHIGNRDTLVSTVAVVLVGFISIVSDMFTRSLFWGGSGRRNNERSDAQGIFLIIGIVLSILAPLAATLMQLAISRRRELLADASGALLTRYPDGLIGALQKLGGDRTPSRYASNTTAHLWFENPFDNKRETPLFAKLFMTHPPMADRIKALRGMRI
jgi:heat shock protein HtpX